MGDNMTLDQLKPQYRTRFYRDRSKDLPEFQPGRNVLSAIKDYFHETSGEESPGISKSSFFADSETNINISRSMKKRTDSSTNPRISKVNRLYSTGEKNETKMKAATSSAANEKLKTPSHFNNFDDVVSEEEVDDCESDMPLNLVVERDKVTEIVRSVRSASRGRIYSLDSSVVEGPPSPASKSSPKKRLRFSDAVVNDKESFGSVFASRYKRGPAEDVQTMQMHESVSYAGNKSDPRPNATSAQYVATVGDDEFVIEDEDSINLCFSFVDKISSLKGSKEERSAASSSPHGNQKLEPEASEVISGPSPISQRKSQARRRGSNVNRKSTTDESKAILSSEGSEETKLTPSSGTRGNAKLEAEASEVISGQSPISQRKGSQTRRGGSNVNRKSTTDESKNISGCEGPEETKMTPSSSKSQTTSATYESQTFSAKFKAMLAQSIASAKGVSKPTRQTKKELEMAEEEHFDTILDTNREKIQIPRNPKSKVERSKSSSVSHQVEVEIEPTKTVSEQSTVQSQAVENALKDDIKNKTKDSLCNNENTFASHLVRFANIRPSITRIDISDLPVTDEDEFVIHDDRDFENDPKSFKKKTVKISDGKKNNKRKKNVACEVFNATYTNAIKNDNATDSKSHNDGRDSSSPLTVSHQMEVEIEPIETVSKQSIVQSQTVGNTLKDDKTNKRKDSLRKDKNCFASHLARIVNIQPPLTRMDVTDLPVVDEDAFVIHDNTDLKNDPKSCKKKTVKNPNNRKKKKERRKNAACEVFNATYTSARTSDNNATDLRKSHNDERDLSPSDKKKEKSRHTELDRLVLQKYFQADVDNLSESISSRPKRASAPPSNWWVVRPAERNSTFDVEEDLPQSSPKSKSKASADSNEPSEPQKNKEESFELKESSPLDQNEEKTLKESDEKFSNTLNTWKRTKNPTRVESEETTGPSKAKRPKKSNRKKIQAAPKKIHKSTKLQKQLQQETQDVDTKSPQKNDLNVPDLSNEANSFSSAPILKSPTMSEPRCPSPRKHEPILDESSKKSPGSGSGIQHKYLKNWTRTEERELRPYDRLPHQSYRSPAYDSAKLTFQSGPVLKTRAMRCKNRMDTVVRNLSTAASLNNGDMSPLTIVLDPDTDCDVISDCVQNARESNPSLVWRCFNNTIFSAGKIVLKPTEEDMRDTPKFDILVFYIVRGSIVLKLHKSYHTLESGDFFYIPPCNTYHIQNLGNEDVELVFTQLKTTAK
ncbi:centromere protein C isoform X3 [Rana temporaria]|uniref:centromere protein C isoform X3 n=1 Tax=Rana temporaria TaxID=8407 RepID=UPI001AADCF74|nr:centromere protein C isoform X3 [Rana temporaria]